MLCLPGSAVVLKVKIDETCRLAGETRTVENAAALRERLERDKRRQGAETGARDQRAIAEGRVNKGGDIVRTGISSALP